MGVRGQTAGLGSFLPHVDPGNELQVLDLAARAPIQRAVSLASHCPVFYNVHLNTISV